MFARIRRFKHWICDEVPTWELWVAYLLTVVIFIAVGPPRRFVSYAGGNLEATLAFVADMLILAALVTNVVIYSVGMVRAHRWYKQSPRFQEWTMWIFFVGIGCFAAYSLLFNFDASMVFLKTEAIHMWQDPIVRFMILCFGALWVLLAGLALFNLRISSRRK
ncbi:MAG TPA: hypothetical protein VLB83_02910 [Candidatus Paceibacterota bacterium]|nr:hypothetical protein [Candidatus Paceibacterota bacterium]